MRLGVIGTGEIASAALRGIAADGHDIVVSERSRARSAALAAAFPNVSVARNQAVLDRSEVVFLGLVAGVAAQVLKELRFRPDLRVVSFMAGVALDEVQDMVRPARAAAVMIPFPAIARGGSPIMVHGDAGLIRGIFGVRNRVFELAGDDEMAAWLCAQAVLSPVVRMVGDAAGWLRRRAANPEDAEEFLRLLVASSLSASDCASLIAALDTPGGYNRRLRRYMEEGGMRERLLRGLDRLEGEA